MLEVSRDAVAAGEEQIFSSAAGQSKYCSICTVTLNPCGVYLSRVGVVAVYSRRRWRFERLFCRLRLRKRISVWGPAGGIPSQPNEAMARIGPRRNGTISLDPSCRVKIPEKVFLNVDSKLFSKFQVDSKRGLGWAVLEKGSSPPVTRHQNPKIYVQRSSGFCWTPLVL
jgi:hypothetical protein